MADERVNLKVDIDVTGDNQLGAAAAKLAAFSTLTKNLETRTNRLTGAMGAFNVQMTRSKRGLVRYTQQLTLLDKLSARFIKSARLMLYGVIALGIEFAVSALSLAAVNGMFAVGKFAMQAYNYGMQALAGTIAAVGVAAIAAAAAFKEFQAAQFQYRYKDSAQVGSALDQSASGLRSLYRDASLATFGVQALAGAFAAVNKNAAFTPASKAALKGLTDFVQASGDPANSLLAAGTMIGILQKEKKFTAESSNAAKGISPEFDKAFKKGNYKSVQTFLNDLGSGKLASEAGVTGQADSVGRTLFGQFKSYLSLTLVELSDIGVRVLEPVKESMHEIFKGLTRAFRRVSGDLVTFGRGPFLKAMVGFTRKLEDFTIVLFRKFLPATEGFWKRTTTVFKQFAVYFREVKDALQPLREGGSIVIDTFGKPILAVFTNIGRGVKELADSAVKHKDNFLEFGDALKSVVDGFFELTRGLREAFAQALPVISAMTRGVGSVLGMFGKGIKEMAGGPGGSMLSSLLLAGLGVAAFKGRRAARYQRRNGGRGAKISPEDAPYLGIPMHRIQGNMSRGGGSGRSMGSIQQILYDADVQSGKIKGNMSKGNILSNFKNFWLGKAVVDRGNRGFVKNAQGVLGLRDERGSGNFLQRMATGQKGGNFGEGYRQAQKFHADALAKGDITGKFSKIKGLKSAARYSASGFGLVAALAGSEFAENDRVADEAKNAVRTGSGLMAFSPTLGVTVGGAMMAKSAKTKMGGALSGAASGAAIGGSTFGAPGAAIGATVGAIAGAISANFNQKDMVKTAMKNVGLAQLSAIAAGALKGGLEGNTTEARQLLEMSGNLSKDFAATKKLDGLGGKTRADRSAKGIAARKKLLQPYVDAGILDGNALSLATGDKNKDASAEILKVEKTMQEALGPAFNQFDEIMNSLKQSTGMTSAAIYELAMEKNVDLYDTTLKLSDAVQKLGVGMTLTATQLKYALLDIQVKSLDVFSQFKQSKEMKDAIQSSGDNLRGGDTSTEAFLDYYSKIQDFQNITAPDNPLSNFITQSQRFGSGVNIGKGSMFGPNGTMSGITMGTEAKELIDKAQQQTLTGSAFELTKQINTMVTGAGFKFDDGDLGFKGTQQAIEGLITKALGGDREAFNQVTSLENALAQGTALQGLDANGIMSFLNNALGAGGTILNNRGPDGRTGNYRNSGKGGNKVFGTTISPEMSGQLAQFKGIFTEEAKLMREQFFQALKTGFFEAADAPVWWNQAPDWWELGYNAELENGVLKRLIAVGGDTATAKAGQIGDTSTAKNLKRTMGRHSSFDGMLPGKRTVTSSLRNFNLGSPNSDHATGNAYDLVGQNLGSYSSLIKSAGGFSEFHGSAGSRHLHVVPPPGPMGDTSVSMLSKVSGGGGGTSVGGDTFNITVNETGNAQTTAKAVAQEIVKMQRNWNQRV